MGTIQHLKRTVNLAILTATISCQIVMGQWNENGRYPVFNFSPKEYNALEQNWCAVQDHRGIMYFGNNYGVLEYDGEQWTIIPEAPGSPIYSMTVDGRES